MKVLFDNNVPAPLRRHLVGHEVSTARQRGWAELGNGELLREGESAGFEVMVTGDKNLAYQQNLEGRKLALVVLPTIDWTVLQHSPVMLADIAAAVDRAAAGSYEALLPPRRPPSRSGLEP